MDQQTFPYRMPAEWAPHAATLLAWPHQTHDWPGKFAPIPWVYAEIIRHLAASEPVLLLIPPDSEEKITGTLGKNNVDLANVAMLAAPTDRVWVRDSGPIGVRDAQGKLLMLDWQFNAWAKYDNWQHDNDVPRVVAENLGLPCEQPQHSGHRVTLEGGAIDVNGAGLLLTTEECLLSSDVQCRNPGFTYLDYEQVFRRYLGIRRTIWLNKGIAGDDTHGHVDDVARFVNATTVVVVIEDDRQDPNHAPLQENYERLKSEPGIKVVALPMPDPMIFRDQRLPASYANFYIGNQVVLVPTFNDVKDRMALGILAELFPDRRVIGIHSGDLIWGLGTMHCLTQQIVGDI